MSLGEAYLICKHTSSLWLLSESMLYFLPYDLALKVALYYESTRHCIRDLRVAHDLESREICKHQHEVLCFDVHLLPLLHSTIAALEAVSNHAPYIQ